MSDRFNHSNNSLNTKAADYEREMQLLRNMESVHLRKKAAFDELLRYTYSSVKETTKDSEIQEPK